MVDDENGIVTIVIRDDEESKQEEETRNFELKLEPIKI